MITYNGFSFDFLDGKTLASLLLAQSILIHTAEKPEKISDQ